MAFVNTTNNHEVEDSASAPVPQAKGNTSQGKPDHSGGKPERKGGDNQKKGKSSNTSNKTSKSVVPKSTGTGFAEGNTALLQYGLGVSGRKERILSPVKADKFFHMVEDSYRALIDAKPHAARRFSLAEFRHASALQFYQRLENVKFDGIGVKPNGPTRIPLPRNLRVFQPLWGALANIGIVEDEELRVTYIPDGILPRSEDISDPDDIRNLISCTLYDWSSSWEAVEQARSSRPDFDVRDSYTANISTNERPGATSEQLIAQISETRALISKLKKELHEGKRISMDGKLYTPVFQTGKDNKPTGELDQDKTKKTKSESGIQYYEDRLEALFDDARSAKAAKLTPRFDRSYDVTQYRISDGTITQNPGAYGAWLRWDPQLWLDYEQFVEETCGVAMYSQSMPVETVGTYAWLLPVETFTGEVDVFCKLPKASIPPVTWILALLLQSSTLNHFQRANFYTETDRLANVAGLRIKYIQKAISRGAPMEQYGTY